MNINEDIVFNDVRDVFNSTYLINVVQIIVKRSLEHMELESGEISVEIEALTVWNKVFVNARRDNPILVFI